VEALRVVARDLAWPRPTHVTLTEYNSNTSRIAIQIPKEWQSMAVNDSVKWQSMAVNDSVEWQSMAVNDSVEWQSMAVNDSVEWQSMAVTDTAEWRRRPRATLAHRLQRAAHRRHRHLAAPSR
jgi:hypothetical protein